MDINRYNYWLYAVLTIFFCWILYNTSMSNWTMLSFYLLSCFYLALYFLIKLIVKYKINRKYKKKIDNLDCNINECKNVKCDNLTDKNCDNQKYCKLSTSTKCESVGCEDLDDLEDTIKNEIDNNLKSKLEKLNYYKIRGIDFKKHIDYYLIILIITFFIYLFIIILMK